MSIREITLNCVQCEKASYCKMLHMSMGNINLMQSTLDSTEIWEMKYKYLYHVDLSAESYLRVQNCKMSEMKMI